MQNWALYTPPLSLLADHGLACLGGGEFSGTPTAVRGRKLDSYALVFVSAGTGHYEDPTVGTIEVTGPALINVFPGRPHGYWTTSTWSEHWILFTGATVNVFEGMGVLERTAPVRGLQKPPGTLDEDFARLRAALEMPGWRGQLRASSVAQQIIAAAADNPFTEDRSLASALQADAGRDLSLADRARLVGLSVTEVRERVRRETGVTPHELIINTRIERAGDLLATTALSVEAVGRSVGYDDPAYFSRIFRRRIGVAPSVFRAQHGRVS
ncbi:MULTISPECIES: helix-turn-helix domain-containing protein [Microbacterium]|uniref:helix-turn-helix domain-containing protein n=1 Tax=Microbacterium TaxID=33882 RepID=UPI00062991BD|nr:helix-turn-helix transcriptional regulator [Microbacterium sp. Ag1]KKX99344.1 hypothetical protein AAY78_02920 [Microbacterium sp. Ag1]